MKTSSKYRRLIRQRKLRRQRTSALLIFIALIILVSNVAFSKQDGNDKNKVIPVRVQYGDTLWSIAKEFKPDNIGFNEYLHMISSNNGVKDGNIVSGQTLYIPVKA